MEMRSTCNLIDVQTMCWIYSWIYIMIDVQMLIVTYMHIAHSLSLHLLHLHYTMAHTATLISYLLLLLLT